MQILHQKIFLKKLVASKKYLHICVTEIYKTLNMMLQKNIHITSGNNFFPMEVGVFRGALCLSSGRI